MARLAKGRLVRAVLVLLASVGLVECGTDVLVLPRTDGFNNQLLTIYPDIRCAQMAGARLVVPHMFEHSLVERGQAATGWPHGPFPFSDYFDMNHLSNYVDVVTPDEYFAKCRRVFLYCPRGVRSFSNRRLKFPDGQPTNRLLAFYSSHYNVKFYCTNLLIDGKPLATMTPQDCEANVTLTCDHGFENSVASTRSITSSEAFYTTWKTLSPSQEVLNVLEAIKRTLPSPYNCLHYRGADFNGDVRKYVSEEGIIRGVQNFANPYHHLYIMSPPSGIMKMRALFLPTGIRFSFLEDYTDDLGEEGSWIIGRNDVRMLLSQLVCAHALQFVGYHMSSASLEVAGWRHHAGQEDSDTFYFQKL